MLSQKTKPELSGHQERLDLAKKGQHGPKKSDHGTGKLCKEAGPAKTPAHLFSVLKKNQFKTKGAHDVTAKDNPSVVAPKRSYGANDPREKSKESKKSRDFGKLLKKVTNSL